MVGKDREGKATATRGAATKRLLAAWLRALLLPSSWSLAPSRVPSLPAKTCSHRVWVIICHIHSPCSSTINRLHRAVVKSPSLDGFKMWHFRTWFSGMVGMH